MTTLLLDLPTTAHAQEATADVGFAVVNFNTAEQTLRCVRSLAACTPPPAWITVLDNASHPSDLTRLKNGLQAAPHSRIRLWGSPVNLGFAAGCNLLIADLLREPDCTCVGLLNNDAVALPGLVALLRDAVQQGHDAARPIGLAGARMHRLHAPDEVDTLGITLYASLMPADRKDTQDSFLGPTGGCCLATRMLLDDLRSSSGYWFDERFFCYCEDTDLVLRAVLLGYQPTYVDTLGALHEGQASARHAASDFIAYHGLRNTIWMHAKLVPGLVLLRHLPWLVLAHMLTLGRQTLAGRFSTMCRVYRDALHGLTTFLRERRRIHAARRISAAQLRARLAPGFYRRGYLRQVLRELFSRY